jgi:hypothetical protein
MKKTIRLLSFLVCLNFFCANCGSNGSDKDDVPVDTVPMLVMQIQKCSRLYTTEYRVHKIVTHDDVVKLRGQLFSTDYSIQLPLGDRKVAIPMDATLKAYIDFQSFSRDNISLSDGKINITLPDPRIVITDTKIDNKGVREYVSLTRSHFSDRELSAFELQGREAIIANIPQMGIIETARESAARLLIPLVCNLGYREEDVTISFSRDFNSTNIRSLLDIKNVEK